jgi:hypothetical protein
MVRVVLVWSPLILFILALFTDLGASPLVFPIFFLVELFAAFRQVPWIFDRILALHERPGRQSTPLVLRMTLMWSPLILLMVLLFTISSGPLLFSILFTIEVVAGFFQVSWAYRCLKPLYQRFGHPSLPFSMKVALLWGPLGVLVVLSAILARTTKGGLVKNFFVAALIWQLLLIPLQCLWVIRVRRRRWNQIRNSTDQPEALATLASARSVRRRIKRRLVRRSLGTLPMALALIGYSLGAFGTGLGTLHFLGRYVLGFLLGVAGIFVAVLVVRLAFRRIRDLFGHPLIMLGTKSNISIQQQEYLLRNGQTDKEIVTTQDLDNGVDRLMEMTHPYQMRASTVWILTRQQGLILLDPSLGRVEVELVSGAWKTVPLAGSVALVCSSSGRCIGKLAEFHSDGLLHRSFRWRTVLRPNGRL